MAFVIDPKPQPSATKQKVCSNCGCLFGYTKSDVSKHSHNHDYLGDYDVDDAVSCPNCHALNFLLVSKPLFLI